MSYCATYCRHGAGRSINARIAESEGKRPLTRAIPEVAEALGVTRAQARNLILYVGACEWHHVAKYANECNYYDVQDIICAFADADNAVLREAALDEDLEFDYRRDRAAKHAVRQAECDRRWNSPTPAEIEADHAEALAMTAERAARRAATKARHEREAEEILANAAYYVAYYDETKPAGGASRKARTRNLSRRLHVGKDQIAEVIERLRATLGEAVHAETA